MNDAVFDADLFDRHMLRTLQLLGGCSRNTLISAVPGGTSPRVRDSLQRLMLAGTVAKSEYNSTTRYFAAGSGKTAQEQAAAFSSARARDAARDLSALTPPRRYTNAAIDPHSSPLSLSGFNVSPRAGGDDNKRYRSLK